MESFSRAPKCSAEEIEPEQSYPSSYHLPCPPPCLYGLNAISLPASMMAVTASGAFAGGGAGAPLLSVAFWTWTYEDPPDGGCAMVVASVPSVAAGSVVSPAR